MTVTGEPELQFAPADRITIGRDPSCDLVVADELVSRGHCVIEQYDGQWRVVDTSSNGTFGGDQRISSHPLGGGEPVLLRLGSPDTGPAVSLRVGALSATPAEPTMFGPVTDLIPAVPDDIAALHPLSGEPLITGRESDNDVGVDDLLVSRHHATVHLHGPGVVLVNDRVAATGRSSMDIRWAVRPCCPATGSPSGGAHSPSPTDAQPAKRYEARLEGSFGEPIIRVGERAIEV